MKTLVIRFSSLGDIALTGSVTGNLSPVTYLTHSRYAELAAALPGVEHVIRWGEDPIEGPFDRVIDLHGSLRSRWISAQIAAPTRTIERYDVRRRMRVWLKRGAPPPRVIDRYARAAGVPVAEQPWIPSPGPRDTLCLLPTARWATKRWPIDAYRELGRSWSGPILLLGGPEDREELIALQNRIGAHCDLIAETGFQQTLHALGRGALAVGGDTGLLHLCAAAGMPVIGIFGPTTSEDGFWCHEGTAVELDLPCRPCSRHGSDTCPIGDHRCMQDLQVDMVLQAMEALQ